MKTKIERIQKMELLFDFALKAIKEVPLHHHEFTNLEEAINLLANYYTSNEWKQDYANDEAGLLPKELKRGVLSEDGIWNLLTEWKRIKKEHKTANKRGA